MKQRTSPAEAIVRLLARAPANVSEAMWTTAVNHIRRHKMRAAAAEFVAVPDLPEHLRRSLLSEGWAATTISWIGSGLATEDDIRDVLDSETRITVLAELASSDIYLPAAGLKIIADGRLRPNLMLASNQSADLSHRLQAVKKVVALLDDAHMARKGVKALAKMITDDFGEHRREIAACARSFETVTQLELVDKAPVAMLRTEIKSHLDQLANGAINEFMLRSVRALSKLPLSAVDLETARNAAVELDDLANRLPATWHRQKREIETLTSAFEARVDPDFEAQIIESISTRGTLPAKVTPATFEYLAAQPGSNLADVLLDSPMWLTGEDLSRSSALGRLTRLIDPSVIDTKIIDLVSTGDTVDYRRAVRLVGAIIAPWNREGPVTAVADRLKRLDADVRNQLILEAFRTGAMPVTGLCLEDPYSIQHLDELAGLVKVVWAATGSSDMHRIAAAGYLAREVTDNGTLEALLALADKSDERSFEELVTAAKYMRHDTT